MIPIDPNDTPETLAIKSVAHLAPERGIEKQIRNREARLAKLQSMTLEEVVAERTGLLPQWLLGLEKADYSAYHYDVAEMIRESIECEIINRTKQQRNELTDEQWLADRISCVTYLLKNFTAMQEWDSRRAELSKGLPAKPEWTAIDSVRKMAEKLNLKLAAINDVSVVKNIFDLVVDGFCKHCGSHCGEVDCHCWNDE